MSEIFDVLEKLAESEDGREHIILYQGDAFVITHDYNLLKTEVDRYDKLCTETRNALTSAGIPDITPDGKRCISLPERVNALRAENERLQGVEEAAIKQSQDVQMNWLSPVETVALQKQVAILTELVRDLVGVGKCLREEGISQDPFCDEVGCKLLETWDVLLLRANGAVK